MHNPCWSKVLRDLWGNKTRTLLVVLSIAVGVFAVGMMAASQAILARNMDDSFMAIDPSSARLDTEAFDDDLVRAVRNMPEVREAEGRYRLDVRVKAENGEWRSLQLFIIPDYADIQIDRIVSESGAWPPPDHAILIERAALGLLNAREGDSLLLETPSRKRRQVPIAGIAHDLHQWPANFGVTAYGYATLDTLEWLGETRVYNELYVVASENPYDKAHAHQVATLVKAKIEKTGREVFAVNVRDPGKHNAYPLVQSLTMMLGVIGAVALLLSGFLVINTISALLAQQVRQIGIMKAVGARTLDVMWVYLSIVTAYGVLALAIAAPLGVLGARWFSGFILNLFNFDLVSFQMPPSAIALQIAVALIVPLLAAFYPIIAGARITVREAMNSYGLAVSPRIAKRRSLSSALPQSLVLSLRNTFRRKGRLALTVTTLTLGGAMFIAVVSVRGALFLTLDQVLQYWKFDLDVYFQGSYATEQVVQEALGVPGVVAAEAWGNAVAFRVRPDGSEHEQIVLSAPPPNTRLIEPIIGQGRWLVPEDEDALVVNSAFLQEEQDVRVGDTIVLKIEGHKSDWHVVGIATGQIAGMGPVAYTNRPYLARLMNEVGSTNRVVIETERHDPAFQAQVRQDLEARLKRAHLRVQTITTNADIRASMGGIFNIFVLVTLVMALLLAVVGGLGLMGLMSLNVLERRREIGVLRAVGASNSAMLQIIMAEGVLIGLLSWILAVGLAAPFSALFGYGVGVGFLNMPLAYSFSVGGVGLWFGVAVVLAALASFLPAWHASRLTVRDVLAYE